MMSMAGWCQKMTRAALPVSFSHWRKAEAVDHDPNLLVVSSGDLWTGPALSTCFAGESTIDVMNAMGYRAAAIGNHDFDNGVDVLRLRAAQQISFPVR